MGRSQLAELAAEGRARLARQQRPAPRPPLLPPPSTDSGGCKQAAAGAAKSGDESGAGSQGTEAGTGREGETSALGAEIHTAGSGSSGEGREGSDARLLEAAARGFLALMCDGRLVPTDWLNAVRGPAGAWLGAARRAKHQLAPGARTPEAKRARR